MALERLRARGPVYFFDRKVAVSKHPFGFRLNLVMCYMGRTIGLRVRLRRKDKVGRDGRARDISHVSRSYNID